MEVKKLPLHLSEITLGKFIGWNNTYGQQLLKDSARLKTEDDKMLFQDEFYTKHYAWFSDTPYEAIYDLVKVDVDAYVEVLKVSAESLMSMQRELIDLQEVDVINGLWGWNDVYWKIKPPVVIEDETKVTLAQFDKVQDVALILSDLQDGRMEALAELCEMYLVMADGQTLDPMHEPFDMMQLPLSIAKCVQKYMQDTVNLYKLMQRAANDLGTTD